MATSKVRRNTRLAVTVVVAAVTLSSGCWFQPAFGPRRSAHNPHERRLTSANAATLTEAWSVDWRADLGGSGGTPQVLAAPTVGNGQVYVASSDGRVRAFDADGCGSPTCPAAWAASTGNPVTAQPALAGDHLRARRGRHRRAPAAATRPTVKAANARALSQFGAFALLARRPCPIW